MQGPFPASNMIDWHVAGFLHDTGLPVCGTERKGEGARRGGAWGAVTSMPATKMNWLDCKSDAGTTRVPR